jgi:hypothetical protein
MAANDSAPIGSHLCNEPGTRQPGRVLLFVSPARVYAASVFLFLKFGKEITGSGSLCLLLIHEQQRTRDAMTMVSKAAFQHFTGLPAFSIY